MPSEKFYDSATAVEGDGNPPVLDVAWGTTEQPGSDQIDPNVYINGVAFDQSGIDRLIRALRRASRRTWGLEVLPGVIDYGNTPGVASEDG